jgi:hypothetical protein
MIIRLAVLVKAGGTMHTISKTIGFNNLLGLVDNVRHVNLAYHEYQTCHFVENCTLTPTTCLAPALAANILRMPVPHPTSKTVLSLNK